MYKEMKPTMPMVKTLPKEKGNVKGPATPTPQKVQNTAPSVTHMVKGHMAKKAM
jgi:hypothetical protein